MSDELHERVAVVEQNIKTFDRRIDVVDIEIKSLRASRHDHNGILQNHTGILKGIGEQIVKLTTAIDKQSKEQAANTKAISDFKVMGRTGLYLVGFFGTIIISLLGFIGKMLMG